MDDLDMGLRESEIMAEIFDAILSISDNRYNSVVDCCNDIKQRLDRNEILSGIHIEIKKND